jgi:hypothetical protein
MSRRKCKSGRWNARRHACVRRTAPFNGPVDTAKRWLTGHSVHPLVPNWSLVVAGVAAVGFAYSEATAHDDSDDDYDPSNGTDDATPPSELTDKVARLNNAIDAQDVENNPIFQKGYQPWPTTPEGSTWCNTFCQAVMNSIIAGSLPTDTSANDTVVWLRNTANKWTSVDAQAAQDWANQGGMALAVYKNTTVKAAGGNPGHGHMAVVRPGPLTDEGVSIAQAGTHNYNDTHLSTGFGKAGPVEYFTHPFATT